MNTWSRLRRIDQLLVALLMPVWFVALFLHWQLASTDTLRLTPIFLQSAIGEATYPHIDEILEASREDALQSGIKPGDEVLAFGARSLAGMSGLEAGLMSFAALKPGQTVTATLRRDGRVFDVEWPFIRFPLPWWWPSLFGASFGLAGLLILLSAPASRTAQAVFPAFGCFALTWLLFPGQSFIQSVIGLAVYLVSMVFSGPLIVRAVMLLPDRTAIQSRLARHSVWLFALMAPVAFSAFSGQLLPASVGQQLHLIGIALFYIAILAVLARNYLRADALGRRQLRWVALGFYLAFIPALFVTLSGVLIPERFTLYTLSSIGMPLIPLAFLIAIARYNLFDIDRVIGGTLSYSLLVVLIAVLTEALVEPLVALGGTSLGLDGDSVQIGFVALLTTALIPVQRKWRPFVDRIFFAQGVAVDKAIETLVDGMATRSDADATMWLSMGAHGLAEIYGLNRWSVMRREGDGLQLDAAHGEMSPGSLALPVWLVAEKKLRPAMVETADGVSLLAVPLRPQGRMSWLMLLPCKPNGDIYTPTDIGLIAQVSQVIDAGIAEHASGLQATA